jgi:kinesin family member C1
MPTSNSGTARRSPLSEVNGVERPHAIATAAAGVAVKRGLSARPPPPSSAVRKPVTHAAPRAGAVPAKRPDTGSVRSSALPVPKAGVRAANARDARLERESKAALAARRSAAPAAPGRTRAAVTMNFTSKPQPSVTANRGIGVSQQRREQEERDQVALEAAREQEAAEADAKRKAEARELAESLQLHFQEQMQSTFEGLKEQLLSKDNENISATIDALTMNLKLSEEQKTRNNVDLLESRSQLFAVTQDLTKAKTATAAQKSEYTAKLVVEMERAASLERELKALNTTLHLLETDKKFVESAVAKKDLALESLNTKHATADKDMQSLRANINRLEESLQHNADAKAAMEKQVDEARVSIRELQRQVCDLQMKAMQDETELRKIQAEKKAVVHELENLHDSLASERISTAKLRSLLQEARDEISELTHKSQQDLTRAKHERAAYQAEMECEIKALEDAKSRATAAEENTRTELLASKSDVAQFRSTVASQESALTSLTSQKSATEVKLGAQTNISAEKSAEIEMLKATIGKQLADIAQLEEQAHLDENERRKLHNTLQELKGNIRVFCRVRPLLGKEIDDETTPVFSYTSKRRGITATATDNGGYSKPFNFDRVFGPTSTQEDVFCEISQLVQSALDGYRVTIFAYGQTGSGKTHTIMGSENDSGMIPRSVQQVFDEAQRLAKDSWEFTFEASFMEIYNEKIGDLLGNGSGATRATNLNSTSTAGRAGARAGAKASGKEGVLKEDFHISFDRKTNLVSIEGLTRTTIARPEDAKKLLAQALSKRSTAATLSNAESSRSHSVFRMYIKGRNSTSGQELSGVLNLVDLAGSERVKASGAEGERLKETKAINSSLTQLSLVIQSLANKEAHIPFRNSRLTRVLQDSLGGDSKTLMFVNVSPTAASIGESVCSLRFAEAVNSCDIGVAKRSTKIKLLEDASPS